MDGIKLEITDNVARVVEKPEKITSGTIGLPVAFSFDSQWDYLRKIFVFNAGPVAKAVEDHGKDTVVPWEVLLVPGLWLSIGVYGINADGSVAIPTTWANICPISGGTDPNADPAMTPTLPVWQEMMNYYAGLTTKPSAKIAGIILRADAWVGEGSLYSQIVDIDGVTRYSQVDLKPSAEQMALFRDMDISFSTENDSGTVTVFAVGDKPEADYEFQVSITEVVI